MFTHNQDSPITLDCQVAWREKHRRNSSQGRRGSEGSTYR